MAARWLAFVIWAAVAAMAAAWSLRLFVPARPAPLHTTTVDTAVSPRGDLSRLFGVNAAPAPVADAPPSDARFKLIGVAASRSAGGDGYALIAVDGKPARAFRLGAAVDGTIVLQDVRTRGATLGPRQGAAMVRLELPAMPAAATGTPGMPAGPAPASQMPGSFMPPQPVLPQAVPPAGQFPAPAAPDNNAGQLPQG